MLLEYITGLQASAIDTFVNQILDLKKEILSRLQFHIVWHKAFKLRYL